MGEDAPRLRPILEENLTVVFVGVGPTPSGKSLDVGHYYANPNNTFYEALFDSGWTSHLLNCSEDGILPHFGIGVDDLYGDPEGLTTRLRAVAPRCVCFNSREAFSQYARWQKRDTSAPNWKGAHAGDNLRFAWGPLVVWAVPDSSPQARNWYAERVALLQDLRNHMNIPDRKPASEGSGEPSHDDPQPPEDSSDEQEVWLTIKEVAEFLGMTPREVRVEIEEEHIEAREIDGVWYVPLSDARRYKRWKRRLEFAEQAWGVISDIWSRISKARKGNR